MLGKVKEAALLQVRVHDAHGRSYVTGVIVTRRPDPARCISQVHAVERAAQIIREDLGHSVRQAAEFSGPIILLAVRTLQLPTCY